MTQLSLESAPFGHRPGAWFGRSAPASAPPARAAAETGGQPAVLGGKKRVLFISYSFPPVGGASVQRVTKFVKYLPRHGWSVSVLTVRNPSVPVLDESLLSDVPIETRVCRARTLEPGYSFKAVISAGASQDGHGAKGIGRKLKSCARAAANLLLQPDPQILWAPDAIRQGSRLLKELPHDAIVASAPSFSAFLIGAVLSRRMRVPLVLDYRDEWGISNTYSENRRPGAVSRFVQWQLQRQVLRSADVLLATTPSSACSLSATRDAAGAEAQVEWIYNGFDPEDFSGGDVTPTSERGAAGDTYRLAYIGTLWNLTDAQPLVNGVEQLSRSRPELLGRLELVFAGRRTGAQEQVLRRLDALGCRVIKLPYVSHREAMGLVQTADGLCVLLTDTQGAERVVPAKIFEYMAARRPVLAITPRGELCDLLRQYPGAMCLDPANASAIADALAAEIERPRRADPALLSWDSNSFSRDAQARQLARILDRVSAQPPC